MLYQEKVEREAIMTVLGTGGLEDQCLSCPGSLALPLQTNRDHRSATRADLGACFRQIYALP